MSNQDILLDKLERIDIELSQTQLDVGYQTRYGVMTPGYKPLVERVRDLEQKLDAIINHLNITVEYEKGYKVREKE